MKTTENSTQCGFRVNFTRLFCSIAHRRNATLWVHFSFHFQCQKFELIVFYVPYLMCMYLCGIKKMDLLIFLIIHQSHFVGSSFLQCISEAESNVYLHEKETNKIKRWDPPSLNFISFSFIKCPYWMACLCLCWKNKRECINNKTNK